MFPNLTCPSRCVTVVPKIITQPTQGEALVEAGAQQFLPRGLRRPTLEVHAIECNDESAPVFPEEAVHIHRPQRRVFQDQQRLLYTLFTWAKRGGNDRHTPVFQSSAPGLPVLRPDIPGHAFKIQDCVHAVCTQRFKSSLPPRLLAGKYAGQYFVYGKCFGLSRAPRANPDGDHNQAGCHKPF